MPEFEYQELLPLGPVETPFRLLTTEGVSTYTANGHTFLQVEPEAIRLLTATAMRDISHLLRPGHLGQLRQILDDPEASENDRFVALDSWRGVCALLVALFHVPIIGVVRQLTLISNGYLFVDFFFVLWGFVIAC